MKLEKNAVSLQPFTPEAPLAMCGLSGISRADSVFNVVATLLLPSNIWLFTEKYLLTEEVYTYVFCFKKPI